MLGEVICEECLRNTIYKSFSRSQTFQAHKPEGLTGFTLPVMWPLVIILIAILSDAISPRVLNLEPSISYTRKILIWLGVLLLFIVIHEDLDLFFH